MKAIIYTPDYQHCQVIADSAIGRDAMPLFLPEGKWQIMPFWAFRIGRLGKGVSAKYAPRYIDGLTLGVLLLPEGEERSIAFMDYAFTPGRWISPEAIGNNAGITIGDQQITLALPRAGEIEQAIEKITLWGTIKTGDIIAIKAANAQAYPISSNIVISTGIGVEQLMHLKVK